jgi:hypothetical protein
MVDSKTKGFIVALIVADIILASLMWTNKIRFQTNDAKLIVASIISAIGILLVVYLIFLLTG